MTLAAPICNGSSPADCPNSASVPTPSRSYRDCLRLLLRFAQARTGRPPARLDLADLDAELVGAFLDHLEADRHNGIDTRNLRLTAIHSLFRYAQLRMPRARRPDRQGARHPRPNAPTAPSSAT